MNRVVRLAIELPFLLLAAGLVACGADPGHQEESVPTASVRAAAEAASLAWCQKPPGGLAPSAVPQFVSVTFDDNFGNEDASAEGGVEWITDFWGKHKNPAGNGNAANFDGTPITTSYYFTTTYISKSDDPLGKNRKAWSAAFAAGHEAADHTVHHSNGGKFTVDQWVNEIKPAKDTLISPTAGIGAKASDVIGFRTPFLRYNDNTFSALQDQKFIYDTTLPNCFDDGEDGTNCSWPYSLESGSHDAEVLAKKFSLPEVKPHPGLWELPATTLVMPPDSVAGQYGFTAGLKSRVDAKYPMPYPSLYDKSTGRLAGLDYTLLIDAKVTAPEMEAILKYNLDLHLSGNRSPFIFIGHSFMYSYEGSANSENTPSVAVRDARWKALTNFVTYALSKPEVRIRAVKDILGWVRSAAATGDGTCGSGAGQVDAGITPTLDAGGAAGSGGESTGSGGGEGSGGTTGSGGAGSGGAPSGSGGTSSSGGASGATGGQGGAPNAGTGVGGSRSGDVGSPAGCSCRAAGSGRSSLAGMLAGLGALTLVARRRPRASGTRRKISG
jgi:hypothetical protein